MANSRNPDSCRGAMMVLLALSLGLGSAAPAGAILYGDLNDDGQVNALDVQPFVEATLVGPYHPAADYVADDSVNGVDVDAFVTICEPQCAPPPYDPKPPVPGGQVFFSTIGQLGSGVAPGNPDRVYDLGEQNGWLYIWSTDQHDFDRSIGLNVVAEPPGVIDLVGAELLNPNVIATELDDQLIGSRWQGTAVGGRQPVGPDRVDQMNAVVATEGYGLVAANDGSGPLFGLLDTGYDVAAGAFLLGSIQYDIVGHGVAHLSINQRGTALFVHEGRSMSPLFGTAMIRVVPELPYTLGDVNRDGLVNGLDVDPFVDRVVSGTFQFEADMNEDGWVNGLDVPLFWSPDPLPGLSSLSVTVPEPSALHLVLCGLLAIAAAFYTSPSIFAKNHLP